ncbi:HDIG domain-containing metalloprotein [endosymbiont GvMRE of Glomus versiforme]|uniref:HDIG domain-containing metalloprotein n=1 Tax=endosymbiont GvMRE of Glomus versiforme TaxID=2039283 RepID=UPI001559202C|nr:HDIG domain-containing metalloprotein [endosymbiont GvMRE of Glomus versiforme]
MKLKKLSSEQKKREKNLNEREKKIENKEKKLALDKEKAELIRRNLRQEEKKINNSADQLFRREELFIQQILTISEKEKKIQEEKLELKRIKEQAVNDLEKIIPMNKEEAKKNLFTLLRKEIDQELEEYKEWKNKEIKEKIKEEGTKIICLALEKCSSELVFSRTTSILQVEDKQMISKIIGKEGRNINTFRRITGTEIIIDKEVEKMTVQISSFNSLRREIAYQTLSSLIREGRITPSKIEKEYYKISSEIDNLTIENGKKVLKELDISNVHPELVKYLGKLKYRTSYGQNVLEHCLEVAKLAGIIASELDLDVVLARRAGLFHDIGKSVEDNKFSHVSNGIVLAKRYKESEIIINAIASHHHDFPANNFYSLIILAADKLSAARPGARGHQLEAYVERMSSIEKIAKKFPGVKKSYAFQAGREIWINIDSEILSDHQAWKVSQKIKKKIAEEIIIPGEIVIYIIREKKFVYRIKDSDDNK